MNEMSRDRASIFHMCIPCGKTLSLGPRSRSSVNVKVPHPGGSVVSVSDS